MVGVAILIVSKAVVVVSRAVVVVSREVVVVEEVVETGRRARRPVVAGAGGASACGAPAGEHAAVKTATTAKAKAKCFTANGFPENTRTTIGIVERMCLLDVPSLFKLIIVCPVTAFLKAGVGGCWGDVDHAHAFVVKAVHPAV